MSASTWAMGIFCRLAMACAVLWVGAEGARGECQLVANDRIAFVGQFGSDHSPSEILQRFMLLRYPELKIIVFPVQLPPRVNKGQLQRLAQSLEVAAPTKIVFSWGPYIGNEGSKEARSVDEQAQAAFEPLLQEFAKTSAKLYWVTPHVVLDGMKYPHGGSYTERAHADQVAGVVREMAQNVGATLIDWHQATTPLREGSKLEGGALVEFVMGMRVALLLDVWQVEPLLYRVNVDWHADTAEANYGTASVKRENADTIRLTLTDAPIPWDFGVERAAGAQLHPCRRYYMMDLRLKGAPPRGITIGTPGGIPLPVLPQLASLGFDLTTIGPLADAKDTVRFNTSVNEAHTELRSILPISHSPYGSNSMDSATSPDLQKKLEGPVSALQSTASTLTLELELTDLDAALKKEKQHSSQQQPKTPENENSNVQGKD